MQQKKEAEFALCEVAKGEVAFCIRTGNVLHIIREHMTPAEAVQMFKEVVTGKISQDDLVDKYQWRAIDLREAGFKGMERMQLPPIGEWPI